MLFEIVMPTERPALVRGTLTVLLYWLMVDRFMFTILPLKISVHPMLGVVWKILSTMVFLIRLMVSILQLLVRRWLTYVLAALQQSYGMANLVFSVAPRTLWPGGMVATLYRVTRLMVKVLFAWKNVFMPRSEWMPLSMIAMGTPLTVVNLLVAGCFSLLPATPCTMRLNKRPWG